MLKVLTAEPAFLTKVVQNLQSEWSELDGHLQQARWPQAQQKAHQLKGICCLLEADVLLESLQHIEEQNLPLISEPAFRQQLQQQITTFCATIKQYIEAPVSS